MTITSKFDKGDVVWFFEQGKVKFFEGTIQNVQNWDKWAGFRYDIRHIDSEGNPMTYMCEESKIFNTKQEVLADLFVEDGVENTPAAQANE